jgi:CD109 antigen
MPDSITSWIITAFSLNEKYGLGLMTMPTKLTVFMPFFITLNLPYAIKRGEIITIQVIIFNYMESDLIARVKIFNEHDEFELINSLNECEVGKENDIKEVNAIANDGTSTTFTIKPLVVGYITLKLEATSKVSGDKIEKKLLVEPEGVTRYFNEAILIEVKNKSSFSKEMFIEVPTNAIENSVKIEASIVGDLLGSTIENLDNLLYLFLNFICFQIIY